MTEDHYRIRFELEFMATRDVTTVQRIVYNLFMLLGDVGGFSGFLVTLATVLVSLLTYKNAENHLVEILFTADSSDDQDGDASKNDDV